MPPKLTVPAEFDRPVNFDGATGPRDMVTQLLGNCHGAGGGTRVGSPDPFMTQ
jgi:hypothetical protein